MKLDLSGNRSAVEALHLGRCECKQCTGQGFYAANPTNMGWVFLGERLWRLPNNTLFMFPVEGAMLISILCDLCFPSYYEQNVIN